LVGKMKSMVFVVLLAMSLTPIVGIAQYGLTGSDIATIENLAKSHAATESVKVNKLTWVVCGIVSGALTGPAVGGGALSATLIGGGLISYSAGHVGLNSDIPDGRVAEIRLLYPDDFDEAIEFYSPTYTADLSERRKMSQLKPGLIGVLMGIIIGYAI